MQPGLCEIYCYDDEVASIKAQVEPKPSNMVAARDKHMLAIAKEVNDKLEYPFTGTMAEFAEKLSTGNYEPAVADALKVVLAETPSSMEGSFHETNGRDLLPLESAEVIEEGISEPQRTAMLLEQEKQAAIMAKAISMALKDALPAIPQPADVAALVAAEVAKLLGEKATTKPR